MIRTVKLSLGFTTSSKRAGVAALLREYRTAINFYMESLWRDRGKLDAVTLKRYAGGSLGYRQKSDCLKMALETVVTTRLAAKATGKSASCPVSSGAVRVSSLCASVETFKKKGFDYCVKLSGLVRGRPIVIPVKSTRVLNKWLSLPGARIKNGVVLGDTYVSVYVEVPDQRPRDTGVELGLDVGYNKLAVASDGTVLGRDFKLVCARVGRKRPGGKGKLRAQSARTQYINRELKRLPWGAIKTLVVEDLAGLKLRTQRKDKSSKKSRRTMAPWAYRQVLNRIEQLAPENRVCLVFVDPSDTSRRCPACGWVAKENRVKERFRCVSCNHSADSDLVGATNILAKMTGNWRDHIVPVLSAKV